VTGGYIFFERLELRVRRAARAVESTTLLTPVARVRIAAFSTQLIDP